MSNNRIPWTSIYEEERQHPLDAYLLEQSEILAKYAFTQGKRVPDFVLSTLRTARTRLDSFPDSAEVNVVAIAKAHAALSLLVAPAKPGTLLLIHNTKKRNPVLSVLGEVPLLQRLTFLAFFLLVGLISVSLSRLVNFEDLTKGMFGNTGIPLLLNLTLLMLASGLGATFSGLYTTISAVKRRQYDFGESVSFFVRFAMGLITGLFISELIPIDLDATDKGSSGAIAKVTLAVLGGFSAHILYGILSKLIESLRAMIGDGEDMLKEIGRIDAQAQLRAAEQRAKAAALAEKRRAQAQKAHTQAAAGSAQAPAGVQGDATNQAPKAPTPAAQIPAAQTPNAKEPAHQPSGDWDIGPLLKPEQYFSQAHPSLLQGKGVKEIPRGVAFDGKLKKYDHGGTQDIYDDVKAPKGGKWGTTTHSRELQVYWRACKNAANYMVKAVGYENPSSDGSINLLQQDSTSYALSRSSTYDAALELLNRQLSQCIPVIVGVSYDDGEAGWSKSGQDHFVVIVGRGSQDGKHFYTYFDPGRTGPDGHNLQTNRLYLNQAPDGSAHDYYISGKRGDQKRDYVLCEVRTMQPIHNS